MTDTLAEPGRDHQDGREPGTAEPSDASGGEDFVWRFRIDEKPLRSLLGHPLDELLRVQWEELLKLCIPMYGGKPVKVDGFATMREPGKVLPIFADEDSGGGSLGQE